MSHPHSDKSMYVGTGEVFQVIHCIPQHNSEHAAQQPVDRVMVHLYGALCHPQLANCKHCLPSQLYQCHAPYLTGTRGLAIIWMR